MVKTVGTEGSITTEGKTEQTKAKPKFTKKQLVHSRKYIHRRDALNALLKDDGQYSFAQVEKIIKQFDEGVKK